MSKDKDSEAIDQGGASGPTRGERGREHAGVAGNAREKGGDLSPDDRDRGKTRPADGEAPAGPDSVRDRAS